MQQLISIETVPISIEYSTTKRESKSNPALGSVSSSAKLNISKYDNQLTIRSDPISIRLHEGFRQNSWQNMSYTATADYSDSILSMNVRIHPDDVGVPPDLSSHVSPMRFQAAGSGIDRMVDEVHKPIDFGSPFVGMKITFNMAQTHENPHFVDSAEANFIPPEIQMEVVEQPKVIIKYIGGPIYFPRSSDPNYKPPVDDAAFKAEA